MLSSLLSVTARIQRATYSLRAPVTTACPLLDIIGSVMCLLYRFKVQHRLRHPGHSSATLATPRSAMAVDLLARAKALL